LIGLLKRITLTKFYFHIRLPNDLGHIFTVIKINYIGSALQQFHSPSQYFTISAHPFNTALRPTLLLLWKINRLKTGSENEH